MKANCTLQAQFHPRNRAVCLSYPDFAGTFTQELYDEAKKQGWIVISMKTDWNRIFAFKENQN